LALGSAAESGILHTLYGWGTNPKTGKRKIIECGLGSLNSVSLKAAREKAAEGRELLNENPPRNPKDVWADQRSASNVPTFGQMADEFLDLMEKEWRSGRHLDRVRATVENHCGPILNKAIDEITQEDVLAVVNAYAEKAPTSATRSSLPPAPPRRPSAKMTMKGLAILSRHRFPCHLKRGLVSVSVRCRTSGGSRNRRRVLARFWRNRSV
jgi:hypothetical protein